MCMISLLIRLLLNKWDNVKFRVCPRKSWVAHVDSLRKELGLQGKVLNVKLTRKALDRRGCEEFEVALQH